MKKSLEHKPVMTKEVTEALNVQKLAHLNKQPHFVDATVGAGGHSVEIIKTGAFVLGIDATSKMLKFARKNLEKACLAINQEVDSCFKLVHGNFKDIKSIVEKNQFKPDGILFDLGISSLHYKMGKGFSFNENNVDLDMRFNKEKQQVKAFDLLNALPEKKLIEMFETTMSKTGAKKIAQKITREREIMKFEKVKDFTKLTEGKRKGKLDASTLPFLALRIAVNTELENLKEGLNGAYEVVPKGARIAVISFHSGEDKIAKSFMKIKSKEGSKIIIDGQKPQESEVVYNKRARSAILRVLEK